jgi:hypothetical protein
MRSGRDCCGRLCSRDLSLEIAELRLPVAHVRAALHEGEPENDRDEQQHETSGDGNRLRRLRAALDVVLVLLYSGGRKKVDGTHL